jgi:drug/metabolite transporter (DMT)-like permease
MLASTLVQSWNWLSIKIAYILEPDIDGFQILFMRTIFALSFLILIINKNLKFVMIDSFPTENRHFMVYRVLSGLLGISSMMVCVKWFSLTTISVVTGLNPVITMIFGVLTMGEKITQIDVICIILSFFAVILMTVGLAVNQEPTVEDKSAQLTSPEDPYFSYKMTLLGILPICMSWANISMRLMRKMNENTI